MNSDSRLCAFLYLLLRDEMPAGKVERLVQEVEMKESFEFSNAYLASYAQQLQGRLGARL